MPKNKKHETIMVLAKKMCRNRVDGSLCGSLWRNITIFPKSRRRVKGTPIECYICRSTDARQGKLDRLNPWS